MGASIGAVRAGVVLISLLSACRVGPPPQPAPLNDAARDGNLSRVRSLLDAGAEINTLSDGDTPLTWAAYNKHLDVVEELCKRGADLNARTRDGFTPLYIGVRWGGLPVAKILLSYGADVNAKVSYDGLSALEYAKSEGLAPLIDLIAKQPQLVEAKKAELERERSAAGAGPSTDESNSVAVQTVVSKEDLHQRGIKSIALPSFTAGAGLVDLAASLSNVALGAAASAAGLRVVGASDIDAMLGLEAKKDLVGCTDVSCMAQIGGALGVDALLVLKLGRIGETYVVNADLVDIKRADVLCRGSANWKGPSDALIGITKRLVQESLAPLTR